MEADAYPDTSFLVSLHRADEHHHVARSYLGRAKLSLAYTPLHRLEVRNALRNAVAFKQMAAPERRRAYRQIEEDLRDRNLIHTPIAWTDVLRRADDLGEEHAARDGLRTIDLLHVAIAVECQAKIFVSFDQRQRRLANAAGLEVKP